MNPVPPSSLPIGPWSPVYRNLTIMFSDRSQIWHLKVRSSCWCQLALSGLSGNVRRMPVGHGSAVIVSRYDLDVGYSRVPGLACASLGAEALRRPLGAVQLTLESAACIENQVRALSQSNAYC